MTSAICLLVCYFLKFAAPIPKLSVTEKHFSAQEVLQKTADKLAGLQTVSYRYTRINDYPGQHYRVQLKGTMHMVFSNSNAFSYQFKDSTGLEVYNGTERFITKESSKKINIQHKLPINSLNSASCLFNSLITLRNSLPKVIHDNDVLKLLSDTIINNKAYYNVHFDLKQKVFEYLGGYRSLTTPNLVIKNNLIIDKERFLPIEFISRNNLNADLNHTLFADVDEHASQPAGKSWYYSTYLSTYTPVKPKAEIAPVKVGQQAPEFTFTDLQTNASTTVAQLKGKLVLIEFWIKNCSYCINAVPVLNGIQKEFAGNNLKIIALNTQDLPEMMKAFNKTNAVAYDTFYGNESIDQLYGVQGYPITVLLDTTGTVVYAGEINEQKLKAAITNALKKI